tara:strand:- start:1429 stop:2181 length:753 start_codon:yes stop_codon:yes gene_type:complete
MKIAVSAKQIPDPAIEPSYNDGTLVRPEEQVLDDTDRYGIELALQMKESLNAEVTVISMGPEGTRKGIQQALQMGPDNALIVSDSKLKNSNSLTTAKILAELVKKIEADYFICGVESTDGYTGLVPQQVARLLSIPCISFIKSAEIDEQKIIAKRQTVLGSETLEIPERAVLSVTAGGVEPRYPNFKDIMGAKSKEVNILNLDDFQIEIIDNLKFKELSEAEVKSAGEKIVDEGQGSELIYEKLKELKAI